MREFSRLLGNGLRYFWTSVPNVHGTNATGKVDVAITIDVFDDGSVGFGGNREVSAVVNN